MLLLLGSLAGNLPSQAGEGDPKGFYLLEDSTRRLQPEEALEHYRKGAFRPAEASGLNVGFTRSVYWLAYENAENLPGDSLLLQIGDHHINRIHFYYSGGKEPQLQHLTGDYYPFRQRPVKATGYYFPIAQKGLYLARIDKANESLQLYFGTAPLLQVVRTEGEHTAITAGLTGIIVLLVIFGVYLFAMTRERIYGLYVIYLACGWCWVLANGGYGFQYLWPDAPWFASKARPVFCIGTVALSIHFMAHYVGGVGRRLRMALHLMSAVLWACVGAIFLFNGQGYESAWWMRLQYAIPVIALAYAVFALAFLIVHTLKGNRLAMFYLVAVGALIGMAVLQVAFYTGSLQSEYPFFSHYGMPVGYIIESIILTAGLVYRFNQYRLEREHLLREVNRRQAENLRVIMEVQGAERRRIANQLHDVAGSLLSAARLNLSSLRENRYGSEETTLRLQKAEEAVSAVSDTVRDLSHALSPLLLEKTGFKTSLEKIVSLFNASGKIRISLVVIGFEHVRPEWTNIYTSLYSIAHELLNNVVKHSGASHALVQVVEHEDCFSLVVEDDGIGLDLRALDGKETHGLAGIQSKIDYFNGEIAFDRNEPRGSIITIAIPRTVYAL
ncbi:MAG TPA: 7TM diverse intracellular signaling domain-containing protein [Chitinophagaceae bacterium]